MDNCFPIACFGLGSWQVHRKKWKEFLISQMVEKTQSDPEELPEKLEDLEVMEYHHVRLRGTFDHERENYIIMRSLLEAPLASIGSLNPYARGGAHVVTPFKLSDRNVWVLVNRGWVRKEHTPPSTRSQGQIEGEVEITGIVRLNEQPSAFAKGSNEPRIGRWVYRDIDSMAYALNTAPIFIDIDKCCDVAGGPVGGQTKIQIRNDHWHYTLTWYTLGLVTLLLWFQTFVRKRPSATSSLDKYRRKAAAAIRSGDI